MANNIGTKTKSASSLDHLRSTVVRRLRSIERESDRLAGEQRAKPQPHTDNLRIEWVDIHHHCRERPAGSIAAWIPRDQSYVARRRSSACLRVHCHLFRPTWIRCQRLSLVDSRSPALSKRAMAAEMVEVMAKLGFCEFMIAGHDRGGRVAHRMALDYPATITKLAVLDIVPTQAVWDRAAEISTDS